MKRYQHISLLAGLLLSVGEPAAPEIVSSAELMPNTITVRVYDYARIPDSTLARATNRARQILERAGVGTRWARCRSSMEDDRPGDPLCDEPMTPADLVLRILTGKMAARMERRGECVGYSIHTKSGLGDKAGIFYHRVMELERQSNAPRAAILGIFMAHEIGHLLLPGEGHTRDGVMRAWWGPDAIFKAAFSKVDFIGGQHNQMKKNIRWRANQAIVAAR